MLAALGPVPVRLLLGTRSEIPLERRHLRQCAIIGIDQLQIREQRLLAGLDRVELCLQVPGAIVALVGLYLGQIAVGLGLEGFRGGPGPRPA